MRWTFLTFACLAAVAIFTACGARLVTAGCPEGNCVTENCTGSLYWSSDNHWYESSMPIPYYVNVNGAANCNGDEFRAVQRAAHNWENLHQTFWAQCYSGTTNLHSTAHQAGNPPPNDRVCVVSWEDLGAGNPQPLGYAYSWYSVQYDSIFESDMSLNDNAAVQWSAFKSDSCIPGRYDVENIATHEFGHWMFLDHSCDVEATMYCFANKGETKRRSPNDCDVLSMEKNYTHTWGQPHQQPGCWPVYFNGWITSHLALGDIDRDGAEEIVFATFDSTLHVVDGLGEELSGWPQKLRDHIDASPAIGDLNGDGWLDIAIACQNDSLYVFDHHGGRVQHWPQSLGLGGGATPAIADLDNDGHLDIICGADSVRAWRGSDGARLVGWPVWVGGLVQRMAPALADLNGDDSLEVVITGSTSKLYALRPHGANLAGWPATTGRPVNETVAIGDIDGDGFHEVVATAQYDSAYAWNADGSRCAGWPIYFTSTVGKAAPSLGNLDADAALEVVFGSDRDTLHALNGNGTKAVGWPVRIEGGVSSSAVIADLDGDHDYEVVVGSNNGSLCALHGNGTPVSGWFKIVGGQCTRTPAIGDIDGNDEMEVVVSDTPSHKLLAYNLGTVLADGCYGWRMYAHDWNRTARYGFEPEAPSVLLFWDAFVDLGSWEGLSAGGANIGLGTPAHSAPFSMKVSGSSLPGAFARAYSAYISPDFSKPYRIKFWFNYSTFYNANWLVFGHARLRIVSPTQPVYVDQAGDWSVLAPMALPFQDFCPANTYVQFEVRVDPEHTMIELFANGQFVDAMSYNETVVPSNRIWFEDREYPGEILYAGYDDFEVYGSLPVVGVEEKPAPPAPLVNVLYQSYPNPMNPTATIQYSVKTTGRLTLRMYDVAGRVVKVLVDELKQASAAPYSVVWDGRNDAGGRVASGVYFCMMETKGFASTKKIVVLR